MDAAALAASRTARIAFLTLLAGALAIALSPIFVRLSEIGPTATAFHRVFLALPALWLWMALDDRGGRRRPAGARDYLALALAGLFFAADLGFWHWSIRFTTVANATLFANFAPIFVTLGGWLLFRDRFTRTFLAGMALALTGAVVLMGESVSLGSRFLLGDALGLITAVFYGAYMLAVKRLRAAFSTATIMAWGGLVSAAALLPAALASGEALAPASLYGWSVLIGLALISQAGGQSLIAYALAHLPAAFSSVSLLLQPAAAAVLAWILFGEALGPVQATGAIVILVGIWLARRGSRTLA